MNDMEMYIEAMTLKDAGRFTDSIKILEKASANGFSHATTKIAEYHENGTGVPKDLKKAEQLYIKAVEQETKEGVGNTAKMWLEGFREKHGSFIGSTAQPPKPSAPSSGSTPVKPVSPTSNDKDTFEKAKSLYNEGKYEEAVFIFKSLAEQNHTEAMHFLAICYQFGRGIKKDAAKAEEWKEKRYELGKNKNFPNRK